MVRRALIAVLLAVAAVGGVGAVVAGGGPNAGGGRAGAGGVARVTRVVDGDTVIVSLRGRRERVRYIGMDTPESVKPGVPVQCFAEAAAAENRRLVAYVYRARDGLFVNAELVRLGYARTLTIPPNVAHATELRRLAARARRA